MRKAVDTLMRFLSRLLGVLLFIAVLTVLAQIASRYIFRAPFGWTDQLCRFLYVWIIMLGLPVLFHTKAVTAFDSLSSKLGKRQQDILHILVCVLSLAFAVCFAWFGWEFMIKKGRHDDPRIQGHSVLRRVRVPADLRRSAVCGNAAPAH